MRRPRAPLALALGLVFAPRHYRRSPPAKRRPRRATCRAAIAGRAAPRPLRALPPHRGQARDNADWVSLRTMARPAVPGHRQEEAGQVFAFDARGRLLGAVPAVLRLAVGDDSVPGIGDGRSPPSIRPDERPRRAARRCARRNLKGEQSCGSTTTAGSRCIASSPAPPPNDGLRAWRRRPPADNRVTFAASTFRSRSSTRSCSAPCACGGIVYVLPESARCTCFVADDGSTAAALLGVSAVPRGRSGLGAGGETQRNKLEHLLRQLIRLRDIASLPAATPGRATGSPFWAKSASWMGCARPSILARRLQALDRRERNGSAPRRARPGSNRPIAEPHRPSPARRVAPASSRCRWRREACRRFRSHAEERAAEVENAVASGPLRATKSTSTDRPGSGAIARMPNRFVRAVKVRPRTTS